ncbi:MAG: hypothetical protein QG566_294 [Patescibacteria group bacterium]|nr:hypothetical protein [Patescibacteria group bacterium]
MKIKNIAVGLLILGFVVPNFSLAASNTFCSQLLGSTGTNTDVKKAVKTYTSVDSKITKSLARDQKLAENKNASDIKKIKSATDKDNKSIAKLASTLSRASTSSQTAALSTYNTTITKLSTDRITADTVSTSKYEADMAKAISTRDTQTKALLATYDSALKASLAQANEDCQDTISDQAKSIYIKSTEKALSTFNAGFEAETQAFIQNIVTSRAVRATSIETSKSKFQTAIGEAKKLLANAWTPPTVVSFSPVDNSTDVSTTIDLVITFSEPVVGKSGKIMIYRDGGATQLRGDLSTDVSGSGTNKITIKPALISGKNYYVTIEPTAFADLGGSYYGGLSNTRTWSFTTK